MGKELNQLASWSKTMITLDELLTLLYKEGHSYEALAAIILKLENDDVLQPVKAAGRTTRLPSVAHRYRIMKVAVKENSHTKLHTYNQRFHSAIRLDRYYMLPAITFQRDLPFLEQLDRYLKESDLPNELVPAPERSAELVGDEKWIDERGGKELLERVQLWESMNIIPVSDPLMMAVNVKTLYQASQIHLIVENKTTYQALLPILRETGFSTLIYGSGNKIIKSIEQFDWQLPIEDVTHTFYYFGDIDRSGLTIWNLLNEKRRVLPAIPFYETCLKRNPFRGKTNQRKDLDAVKGFINEMPSASILITLLDEGFYYPQEILKSVELRAIWREWSWTFTNGKG